MALGIVFSLLNINKAPMINESIILYDGHCMLCSNFVKKVLRADDQDLFRFCPIQSKKANELLKMVGYHEEVDLTTILLISNKAVYTQSTAALFILTRLKGIYPILGLGWLVPTFIRNIVYRWIAKNRIHWFGVRDQCFIPERSWHHKIVTE